jgi:[ribosomal protein S5]-alanine N-acetyltransferase
MASPFFLKSKRIEFRQWTDSDFELAKSLWGNPQVMRFVGGPYSEERVRERLTGEIECQRKFGFQYWPIFSLETEEFVGCCGLRPYKADNSVFELGAHLRPMFWHKGLAEEVSRAVIRFAFRELNANALFAGHHPENAASSVLVKKLGFEFVGRKFYEPTGLMHPSYLLRKSNESESGVSDSQRKSPS